MFSCDVHGKEFENSSRLGGHRSGHTRRDPSWKIPPSDKTHTYNICRKHFETGYRLGGHKRLHALAFEDVKKDGTRKTRLLSERGVKCEICGIEEWCGKSAPIQMDHVDGNPEINSIENLRFICPNCHAQTDSYAGKNRGKFKTSRLILRKKYYKYPSPQ